MPSRYIIRFAKFKQTTPKRDDHPLKEGVAQGTQS
jgi:hypothetical protein